MYIASKSKNSKVPSRWSPEHSRNVEIGIGGIGLTYDGNGTHSADYGVARTRTPFCDTGIICFFEIELLSVGTGCQISVGLCTDQSQMCHELGADESSLGLLLEDGHRQFAGSKLPYTNTTFEVHDCVGCGFDRLHNTVFFTKNAELLGEAAFCDLNGLHQWYPAVSLHSHGECVRANFGTAFCHQYNLQGHIGSILDQCERKVQRLSLPEAVERQLVLDYLLHTGCAKTASQFVEEMKTAITSRTSRGFEEEEDATAMDIVESGARDCSSATSVIQTSRAANLVVTCGGMMGRPEPSGDCCKPLLESSMSRSMICGLVMEGNPASCFLKLQEHYPDVSTAFPHVELVLRCQEVFELLKSGDVDLALNVVHTGLRFNELVQLYKCCESTFVVSSLLEAINPSEPLTKEQRRINIATEGEGHDGFMAIWKRLFFPCSLPRRLLDPQCTTPQLNYFKPVLEGNEEAVSTEEANLLPYFPSCIEEEGEEMMPRAVVQWIAAWLEGTMGLFAYSNPFSSPLKALLSEAQRFQTSQIVNKAILATIGADAESNLRKVLQHMVVLHEKVCEDTGYGPLMTFPQ